MRRTALARGILAVACLAVAGGARVDDDGAAARSSARGGARGGGARRAPRTSFAHLDDAALRERIDRLEAAMVKRNGEAASSASAAESAFAPRGLRILADLKEELERRVGRGGADDGSSGEPRGVLVWSLGRCATGSFADSVKASAGLSYCNNRKEGFGFAGLSEDALKKCAARARRRGTAAMTHVKPQHLVIDRSALATPEVFFAAVEAAGFRGVIVVRRQNHLARLVSSFENRIVEWGYGKGAASREDATVQKRALKFFADPIRVMEWEAAILERGAAEAKRLGLDVVELDFVDVVAHVCGAVATVLDRFDLGRYAGPDGAEAPPCVEEVSHMGGSRRHADLAGRVGPDAAAHVEARLRNTPYAWMLDLGATAWPDGVARPTPVAHPDGAHVSPMRNRPPARPLPDRARAGSSLFD